MIDSISDAELRQLAETTGDHCISIFQPTHRGGREVVQDPTRLKNLVAEAASELEARGLRPVDANDLLDPAVTLLDDADFWAHGGEGLALFVDADGMVTYRLAHPVTDLVVVSDRFHLKPLLASVMSGAVFSVLALSQNEVRLLSGSPYGVAELELGDIPHDLAEALQFDDRERQLTSHSSGRAGRGRVTATFHGGTTLKDTKDVDVRRFLRAVDDGVRQIIGDDTPLVLAGVDDVVASYRQVSRHAAIVEGNISGNPERMTSAELHEQAWPLVRPMFERDQEHARNTFLDGPKPKASSVEEAVTAASTGRVESLFVPIDVECWGSVADGEVDGHDERQPGDRDLCDTAAIETLLHGGKAFAVPAADVPGPGPVAAVLRF